FAKPAWRRTRHNATAANPVDDDVDKKCQAKLAAGGGDFRDQIVCGPSLLELRMCFLEIVGEEHIPADMRREWWSNADLIKAKTGGPLQVWAPCRQRAGQEWMKVIDFWGAPRERAISRAGLRGVQLDRATWATAVRASRK